MNRVVTKGIVLARTNYQEADRILTILTIDHGKISAIAKGVRRAKSKLAGGVELFSVNDLTYISGKREVSTLVSTRLDLYFGNIVSDLNRTMFGYELLKKLNRLTESAAGEEYFALLKTSLQGLNNLGLSLELLELWFNMHLLNISGHGPDLQTDTDGNQLKAGQLYTFDYDTAQFKQQSRGHFDANHIKLLRLASTLTSAESLAKVQQTVTILPEILQLSRTMVANLIRL